MRSYWSVVCRKENMANPMRKQPPQRGDTQKRKPGVSARPGKTALQHPQKLDRISDAPESGEPLEQGRSRPTSSRN